MLHPLEPRRLLSLSISLDEGTLLILGTQKDDQVIVEAGKKQLMVRFSGDIQFTAPHAGIHTIIARGRGGNDIIRIDAAVGATGQLSGGGGNDLLSVGRKSWQLSGDGGHDTLVGGAGRDLFFGGGGIDTIDYSARTSRVWVTLDGKPDDGSPPKADTKGERDNAGPDIENVIGGSGNDRLTGGDRRNVLKGGLGNDTLIGGAGDDILSGDEGADLLQGELGDDVLIAIDHTIDDKLDGGEGYDSAAFDYVLASDTRDVLAGIETEISILTVS